MYVWCKPSPSLLWRQLSMDECWVPIVYDHSGCAEWAQSAFSSWYERVLEGWPALASSGSWPFLVMLVSQQGIVASSIRGKQCETDRRLHIETLVLSEQANPSNLKPAGVAYFEVAVHGWGMTYMNIGSTAWGIGGCPDLQRNVNISAPAELLIEPVKGIHPCSSYSA